MIDFCVLLQTLCLHGLLAAAPSDPPPQAKPYELRSTEARRIAYLNHVGAYWSLSPVIEKVVQTKNELKMPGPIVVRYLDDPLAASPTRLRMEVGFVLSGTERPPSPFKIMEWPPEPAVHTVIKGPSAFGTRHFAALRNWAKAQGLSPVGPMIEFIEFSDELAIEQTELFLPVFDPTSPAFPPVSTAKPPVKTPEPVQQNWPKPSAPAVGETSRWVQRPPVEGEAEPIPDVSTAKLPAARKSETHAEEPVEPARGVAVSSVRDLMASGDYEALAEFLVPAQADPATREWTGQVVLRIGALARGLKKMYPESDDRLSKLAAALSFRKNAVSKSESVLRVIGPKADLDLHAADRRALMQKLDQLLGKVSLKIVKEVEIYDEFLVILEEMADCVR